MFLFVYNKDNQFILSLLCVCAYLLSQLMIMHDVNPTDMLPGQEKQDITNVFAMATSFHWNNFTRCVHFHPRSQIEWELTTVGVFFSLLLYNTLRTLQKIKLCHYKFNKRICCIII